MLQCTSGRGRRPVVRQLLTIKKYPNRRLYDTEGSRYITMKELAERVRKGRDVRVLDAKTDDDLTQATLVQLLTEGGRAHLLPVPLLMQLVRMNDDALAEFYTRYMTWAMELYFAMKQRAGTSFNPFSQMPFDVGGALARLFIGQNGQSQMPAPMPPPPSTAASPTPSAHETNGDIADLRRELAELKRSLQHGKSKSKR